MFKSGFFIAVLALGIGWSIASAAVAPARSATSAIYGGIWHEIARLPNGQQRDCEGATTEFASWDGAGFDVIESCHRGAPNGPLRVVRAKARLIAPGDYTRFRLSFFGGLVKQEYLVLDHADDNSWVITATPGGRFLWLMSRRTSLPADALSTALRRIAKLGYPTDHLIYPAQPAG